MDLNLGFLLRVCLGLFLVILKKLVRLLILGVIQLYIFILLIVLSLNFCQLPSPSTNEKSDEFKGKFPLSFHFSK